MNYIGIVLPYILLQAYIRLGLSRRSDKREERGSW